MTNNAYRKNSTVLSLWVSLALLLSTVVYADDDNWDDDGTDSGSDWSSDEDGSTGFEDVDVELDSLDFDQLSWFSFGGYLKETVGYSWRNNDPNFLFSRDKASLSKLRTTLGLYADLDLGDSWKAKISGDVFYDAAYSIEGREGFSDSTLSTFESDVQLSDTYIEGRISGPLWFKFGRQIIVFGTSDSSTITDVANPRLNLEFGQNELEDIRLPVWASKLTYAENDWELTAAAIHEIRPNETATEGAEFDPFILFRERPVVINSASVPEDNPGNMEFLVRVKKELSGADLSLIYADVYDDVSYFEHELVGQDLVLTPSYNRIKVLGLSGNYVKSSYLFKTDLAFKQNKRFIRTAFFDERSGLAYLEKDVVEGMLGVEYVGIAKLGVTYEFALSHINEYEELPFVKESSFSHYLNFRYEMLNNTLLGTYTWIRLPSVGGQIHRAGLEYDVNDSMEVSASVIVYNSSNDNEVLYPYRRNDRINLGFKYSF